MGVSGHLITPRAQGRATNWLRARNDYVRSEHQQTAEDIARKHKVGVRGVRTHMEREGWTALRAAFIDNMVIAGDAVAVERRVEQEAQVRTYWADTWAQVGAICAKTIKDCTDEQGGVLLDRGGMLAHATTALERAWRGHLGSLGIRPDSRDRGQGMEGVTVVVRYADGRLRGEDGRWYAALPEGSKELPPPDTAVAVRFSGPAPEPEPEPEEPDP